jgi:hypothetical protein
MKRGWIAAFATIVLVLGCSGVKVGQDYDPAMDFGSMETFQWESKSQEKTGDPRIDNPLRDTRIRVALERMLAEKGYHRSTDETPTFLIRYQYALRRKMESGGTSGGIGFGIGSFGRHGGIAIGTGNSVREFDEGTLTVDLVDAASQHLIWRGTGTQRFSEYDNPEKTSRDINRLVEKIMAQFPPDRP